MSIKRSSFFTLLFVVLSFALSACGQVQDTVADRNRALGTVENKSNYFEARQIKQIEEWKDNPGKIVYMYINFPPFSDRVITVQCKGVPTSSTESLEPNVGLTYNGNTFIIPDIDGGSQTMRTEELAGRDGTYGDPIPYSQCMNIAGSYYDSRNVPLFVSSDFFSFPSIPVVKDAALEVRLMAAERIIANGGCVNPETLEEQECN